MTFVLRAKHWQIFLILFGFLFLNSIVGHVGKLTDDVTYLLSFTLQIAWMLGLGYELNKRSEPKRNFRWIMSVGLVLILVAAMFRIKTNQDQMTMLIEETNMYIIVGFVIYLLSSAFAIAGFVARALRSAETGEAVEINDYFKDFLLILFWPIGIWLVQPRINKLLCRQFPLI